MPINLNGGTLQNIGYGSQKDLDVSKQLELLRQLRAQADQEDLKTKLLDPLEKSHMDASVRQFETRKNVGVLPDTPPPMDFTAENFAPMASHASTRSTPPTKKISRITTGSVPVDLPAETTNFGTAAPRSIKRIGTGGQTELQQEADTVRDPNYALSHAARVNDASLSPAVMAAQARADSGADKLVKVEHKDSETGRTVIEWLPQSTLKDQKFQKGEGSTAETRLASAQAVNQTGEDMITKLSNPAYSSQVGVAMGRANTLRDFIGNPPPEFADLAGMIESYSLANMGVHGMRSAQGAEQIKALLDQKHTPESLIATIRGLNAFSTHFMENAGRGAELPVGGGSAAVGDPYDDYMKRHAK